MTTIDLEGFKEKVYRRTKSQTTVDTYLRAIDKFGKFAEDHYRLNLQTVIDRMLANPKAKDYLEVCQVLDKFAGWCVARTNPQTGVRVMPRTTQRWLEGTKRFLRYHGVEISNERYREKVTVPLAEEIPDVALERDAIRRMLLSGMPLWARACAAVMKDAGTRIGETSMTQVGDVYFDEDPVRIHIRKEVTKATCSGGRMARDVFVTSEAADLLKSLITAKKLRGNDRLFYSDRQFRKTLYTWLPKLGLDKKIQGHRYFEIHPHAFRKFFFSNAVGAMGSEATHAMMGHQFYLKTYYKRPVEDIHNDYRKALPRLLVMRSSDEEDLRTILLFDQLRVVFGLKEEQIKDVEGMMRRRGVLKVDEEVQAKIREMVQESWGLKPLAPQRLAAGVW